MTEIVKVVSVPPVRELFRAVRWLDKEPKHAMPVYGGVVAPNLDYSGVEMLLLAWLSDQIGGVL